MTKKIAPPDIDVSFILISTNYLDNIAIDIDVDFIEPKDPRVIKEPPYKGIRDITLQEAKTHYAQLKSKIDNEKNLFDKIFIILKSRRYRAGSTEKTRFMDNELLFRPLIEKAIKQNQPITFVLPSFPFKCPNPTKVGRRSPAMAELLCLARMHEICTVISFIYPPGATFIIIADGQVYKDMFGVSSYEANRFRDLSNMHLKKLGFSDTINIVDMQDLIEKNISQYTHYKELLLPSFSAWWEYHKEGPTVMSLVHACTANIVSDTHVSQDLVRLGTNKIFSDIPDSTIIETVHNVRAKVKKRAEKCAFEYAFFLYTLKEMKLVSSEYPEAIRCTVHPKPKQWGIHLVNAECRIFPWHGVALHDKKGWRLHYEYTLIKNKYNPVHLLDDCHPFFYESEEYPFIPGDD